MCVAHDLSPGYFHQYGHLLTHAAHWTSMWVPGLTVPCELGEPT